MIFQNGRPNFPKFSKWKKKEKKEKENKGTENKQPNKYFRIFVSHKYRDLIIISRAIHYLFGPMP